MLVVGFTDADRPKLFLQCLSFLLLCIRARNNNAIDPIPRLVQYDFMMAEGTTHH
jgi:hypothetical protein